MIDDIIKESQLDQIQLPWTFYSEAGKEAFYSSIQHLHKNPTFLQKRANTVLLLRQKIQEDETYHNKLTTTLESMRLQESIFGDSWKSNEKSQESTGTNEEAESQVLFTSDILRIFNQIPYFINLLLILKVYVNPIFSLFIPLMIIILPYFFMQTMYNMNISWDVYKGIVYNMVLGIKPDEPWTIKHIFQVSWTLFGVVQSMAQPFMNAYHVHKISKKIHLRGQALCTYMENVRTLVQLYTDVGCPTLHIPDFGNNPYGIVAYIQENPSFFTYVRRLAGMMELYYILAQDSGWTKVQWKKEAFHIHNFYDLAINRSKAVKNSVTLQGHSLLTGPNRGGKSSCLRGILQQVIFAQSFGMVYAEKGILQHFDWICTRIQTGDKPGKVSLFEYEVQKASQIVRKCTQPNTRGLILIDELFHSTNPPDAEISAKIFLQQLWAQKHCSIISTHLFSLLDYAPTHVQPLCIEASDEDGEITYHYTLQPGVCFVSSVKDVLKEAGLLR